MLERSGSLRSRFPTFAPHIEERTTVITVDGASTRQFMATLEPYQLVTAAEAVQLLGLDEQANYLIELAYLGFDSMVVPELV